MNDNNIIKPERLTALFMREVRRRARVKRIEGTGQQDMRMLGEIWGEMFGKVKGLCNPFTSDVLLPPKINGAWVLNNNLGRDDDLKPMKLYHYVPRVDSYSLYRNEESEY